jgi:hypothetical protein
MIAQALIGGYANPLRVVDGADFDGTNDYMVRASGLTGEADSKTGILSAWVRPDVSQANVILQNLNETVRFWWQHSPSNYFRLRLVDSLSNYLLDMHTGIYSWPTGAWYHILASWDLAASATHFYGADTDSKIVTVGPTNANVDYTETNWAIGGTHDGATKFSGCLAEFYFAPGQYLDFSIVANRRKFISASGKPVHLGTDGSLPTGTAPLLYLHLDDSEAVANFATNRGTGGNLSITGSLDTASTSPSD